MEPRVSETIHCGHPPEDYAEAIADLFPVGAVWPRDPDSVLMQFADGIAAEFSRVSTRDCNLLAEAYPGSATETISDWERVFGLPDPCTGPLDTLAQRRAAVIAKMSQVGGQSIAAITACLTALGFWVEIDEGPGPYEWTIFTSPATIHYFRTGDASAGERLRWWGNSMLECAVARIKPAHTVVDIAYAQPSVWDAGATTWDSNLSIWDAHVKPPPGWQPPPLRVRIA